MQIEETKDGEGIEGLGAVAEPLQQHRNAQKIIITQQRQKSVKYESDDEDDLREFVKSNARF